MKTLKINKQKTDCISNRQFIPLSIPEIHGNEWRYIKECLDTNWVSSAGKFVERFERSVADYLGSQYAVACVNCTAALHIALLVAGIHQDDEVLMPVLTFVSPANAIRYVNAWPVFIDVQSDTWQIDPQKIEDFLNKECSYKNGNLINQITKRKIRAVLPVHILGHPVDMDPILEIAKRFGLIVIEDAAESLGAQYKNRKVGSLADIGCLSFNGNKIITSGGGGMIATNNEAWADKARYLTTQAKDDPLEYIHNEIGYNYRLTNIQAAMGVAQMECLDEFVAKKRAMAQQYYKGLNDIPGITRPIEAKWAKSNFWLYTILINADSYGISSRKLLYKLHSMNIETRPLWHPLHKLPIFKNCYAHRVEVVDKLYRDALSLPSSVGLIPEQQDMVIETIKSNARK